MVDSWKTDGDCNVCRRRKYCSKQCSANKDAMGKAIHAFLMQKMGLGLVREQMKEAH